MSMTFRIISGAIGLAVLIGTVILGLDLLAVERDAKFFLAVYMGIGCIMLGVYSLFYAITGKWRPKLKGRKTQQ